MDNFADIIINEKDFIKKMWIIYWFQKRTDIFFDSSVMLKTTLANWFIEEAKLPVDGNLVLTACLLCACKNKNNEQDSVDKANRKSIDYLTTLGFSKRFCKICEEYNKRNNIIPREKESDILELVDIFGDLLLDTPERKGFNVDEALTLLEEKYLKGKNNIYLNRFKEFVIKMEDIKI